MTNLIEVSMGNGTQLWGKNTEDNLQSVIRAVYKQVLGNIHLMESQRLESAESLLRNGDISLRNFVRMVAQSELYQSLFFNSSSSYRFIELNCKHLLGRAPLNQHEISRHVQIYNEYGYEAEINSYIDSEEYNSIFGENVVPHPRSITSQIGIKNIVFNRTISLLGGFANSDHSNKALLTQSIGANISPEIKVKSSGIEKPSTTRKKFKITVRKSGTTPLFKQSNIVYNVGYNQLSSQIQNIHKKGGQILSIVEI